MNVLLTDGNSKNTLGIVRHLGKIGVNVYVLSFSKFCLSSSSKYCKKKVILPNYQNEDFLTEFTKALKRYKIQQIIPVGTNSFKFLVSIKNKIPRGVIMITVDEHLLSFTMGKANVYKHAESLKVPVPKSFYPDSIENVEDISKSVTYPCVIKASQELGYNMVEYANNVTELISTYKKLCKKNNLQYKSDLPIIQEYIEGFGCGFFAVYDNGNCGKTFQHKRLREFPPSGGYSTAAESYKNNLIEKYGKLLLDSLKWNGIAMVEFKVNKQGTPYLMEINPKFWGSLDLALEAGVNFPNELIKIGKHENIEFSNNFTYPLRYHWPFDGDIEHAFMKPSNFLAVLSDTISFKTKSNFWIKDIFPSLNLIVIFLFKRIFKNLLLKQK